MNKHRFDRDSYLHRINCAGEIIPTVDCLKALQHAHLYTIPFENFDILLGRDINLEPEVLFHKMVHKKRGGYCFELNGLF